MQAIKYVLAFLAGALVVLFYMLSWLASDQYLCIVPKWCVLLSLPAALETIVLVVICVGHCVDHWSDKT